MSLIKKTLRFIAQNFVFIGGFLFIFSIGAIFAFVQSEGSVITIIFLIIILAWIAFLIKYFWEILDKDQPPQNHEQNEDHP